MAKLLLVLAALGQALVPTPNTNKPTKLHSTKQDNVVETAWFTAAAATVAADMRPARPAVSTTLSCFVEWSLVDLCAVGVGTNAWPSAASTSSSLAILCLACSRANCKGYQNEL